MHGEGQTETEGERGRRIVLATLGSLGDLHPFIAIGKELQARGHKPVLATSMHHKERVERQGIAFAAMRPDLADFENDQTFFRDVMDRKRGSERVVRDVCMPHLRASYDDLLKASENADLLVSQMVTFAGPLVAEVTGIRWLSAILAPLSFLSKYDPSVPPQAPWFRHLRVLGPGFHGLINQVARKAVRPWTQPINDLRKELGLPESRDPLFEGSYSPAGVLALFSGVLGKPQLDWPAATTQTGFPFFDDAEGTGMPARLAQFLSEGDAPLVFTLGSAAVMDAGRFYEVSRDAAHELKRRAVFLIGGDPRNQFRETLPESMLAIDYAPHSELFPRASAIVHQGGVGTTAQALRSGRPMLVVPWGHDQMDNAERVYRLGVARTLSREKYTAHRVATALRHLLDEVAHNNRARDVAALIRQENGTARACDAIEHALSQPRTKASS